MAYNIEQQDVQLLGSKANIIYVVEFDRAAQHLVHVHMTVNDVNNDELVVVMPSWSPGSYKIRDYASYQGNVVVASDSQPLEYRWIGTGKLVINTRGVKQVAIDYVVYCNERTVRTNHVNRFHAFLQPPALFMFVEGRTQEIHHVLLKNDRKLWPNISTQLSPVQAPTTEGTLLGALNYDILADSPLEIGSHEVRTFSFEGAVHEVALASSQRTDIDWLTEQIKIIIKIEASIFGGLPYDRYVFIIQAYPGAGGGLEHARSSVNATDWSSLTDKTKVASFLSLLCHEYFHLWNVKRIRAVELGPFDYTAVTQTPMLWLAEGLTSYYDDLFTYRCGFRTESEYLTVLGKEHLDKLAHVRGRFAMSVRDSSRLSWIKLYMQSPDGPNRFPSYYLKGGIVFLLLDIYIIDHTDGKKSLDDGVRALWQRYQSNPEEGITEEEAIALMERATGVQLRDRMMSWLDGTGELPYAEIFTLAGVDLSLEQKPHEAITFGENRSFAAEPSALFCGWTVAESNGKVIVKTIEDGSPAAIAGIGIDDEIIAIEDVRVMSVAQADRAIASAGVVDIRIMCQCDGIVYETSIRPTVVSLYTLKRSDNPVSKQKAVFEKWLKRAE